jgi:hypothetical protein
LSRALAAAGASDGAAAMAAAHAACLMQGRSSANELVGLERRASQGRALAGGSFASRQTAARMVSWRAGSTGNSSTVAVVALVKKSAKNC